jgi:beta-phosphoglucomutase-like phosphatase (HAD superfamily)
VALIRHALERFGATPAETVFLDDHPANIAAARGLGIPSVLFANPEQAEGELRQLGVLAQ